MVFKTLGNFPRREKRAWITCILELQFFSTKYNCNTTIFPVSFLPLSFFHPTSSLPLSFGFWFLRAVERLTGCHFTDTSGWEEALTLPSQGPKVSSYPIHEKHRKTGSSDTSHRMWQCIHLWAQGLPCGRHRGRAVKHICRIFCFNQSTGECQISSSVHLGAGKVKVRVVIPVHLFGWLLKGNITGQGGRRASPKWRWGTQLAAPLKAGFRFADLHYREKISWMCQEDA